MLANANLSRSGVGAAWLLLSLEQTNYRLVHRKPRRGTSAILREFDHKTVGATLIDLRLG